jgi:tetratricopeptide (TPR) repeat protein
VFELDARSGELRKQGVKIKLQDQPFQILQVLLERPGEVVTREDLRTRIWGADTFVDFEKGLYNAVKKLREALGDDPATPRYIETLPKRGYRFIAPLNGDGLAGPTLVMPTPVDQAAPGDQPSHDAKEKVRWFRSHRALILSAAAGLLVIGLFLAVKRLWVPVPEGETSTSAAYAEYLKGIGYLARYDVSGNIDHAIESLSAAVRLDPHYARALSSLGRAQWLKARINNDAQEREVAIKSILESIRLAPGLAEGHVSLGEVYADTGRTAEAVQEERSALRISPDNAQAYRILGKAYARNGQYEQAETQYREAIRRQPSDWHGYLLLGLFYFDRGRIADARSAYLSALNLTPNNELLYRNLAVLDMSEGKFREASDRIAKTTQFEPVARTYLTLGMAYYYQRRYAESAAAFNSGIQLDANLYGLWGDLGEAYLHIPDSEQKAKDAFRKAITLAEKHLEAVRSDDSAHADLAEYWATLKRKDRAEDEINKIPPQSRNTFADRLVPTYELLGNRRQAVQIVQSLRPDDPLLIFVKNDPDLELLWRDPALRQQR